MDLDVVHRESVFDEMDVLQMDDVGIDAADFMQQIDTKHHGQHVANEMETTSCTWTWLYLYGDGFLIELMFLRNH